MVTSVPGETVSFKEVAMLFSFVNFGWNKFLWTLIVRTAVAVFDGVPPSDARILSCSTNIQNNH